MTRYAAIIFAVCATTLHAGTVSGMLKDVTGDPVSKFAVWAVTGDCLEAHRTVSDNQGRYSFEGLQGNTYKIYASVEFAAEQGWLQLFPRAVRVGFDDDQTVDLELIPAGSDTGGVSPNMPLHGLITDAENHPIEGARITYSDDREHVLSDSRGRFGVCRAFGRKRRLRIEHDQYRQRTVAVKLQGRNFDGDLQIKLQKRQKRQD